MILSSYLRLIETHISDSDVRQRNYMERLGESSWDFPAKVHPNRLVLENGVSCQGDVCGSLLSLNFVTGQSAFKTSRGWTRFLIESGPQEPTLLLKADDELEARVIRSSMRTLAWVFYRFGNVTKDTKEVWLFADNSNACVVLQGSCARLRSWNARFEAASW